MTCSQWFSQNERYNPIEALRSGFSNSAFLCIIFSFGVYWKLSFHYGTEWKRGIPISIPIFSAEFFFCLIYFLRVLFLILLITWATVFHSTSSFSRAPLPIGYLGIFLRSTFFTRHLFFRVLFLL
ncbi:hypothetical protein BCR34DRAFT_111514 [Clohesyomyces aquaticus]|uniref:Uncharacterized protein n=1 Tax=Clohesyomyces aquaticus TaxID=1231657 RepID=A0A1Y1YSK1_9PLEO|nr:hypothetical protein BCR34DRAFT_111514 [Clohesyomyces aquaticus]